MLDFVGRMRIVRFMLWPWQQLTTCATITLYTCTYICNGALMAPCIMAWREAHGKDSLDCPLQAGLACRFFHGRPGGGPPAESTLFPPLGTCGAQAFPPCFGTGATVGRLPISWCIHPPPPPAALVHCTVYVALGLRSCQLQHTHRICKHAVHQGAVKYRYFTAPCNTLLVQKVLNNCFFFFLQVGQKDNMMGVFTWGNLLALTVEKTMVMLGNGTNASGT